jgi:pimeloyl-ACP methyl ester carboxylesterase
MSDWIFLRGLVREQRHWGGFLSEFETRLPDARVTPVDFPGNGELNYLQSPITVQEMVESCRAQLQEQGSQPPYRVLALSMGAMVAVAWSAAYPNEVQGMVLINTSMRPFSAFYQRLLPGNYLPLLGLMMGASAQRWEQWILRATTRHPREDVEDAWTSFREQSPVSAANALRQLWAATRFCAPLQSPIADVLLLTSERDQLVSTQCSQAIARQWRATLAIHPSAGHDLTLDDGPWVVEQVEAWLTAKTAQRRS